MNSSPAMAERRNDSFNKWYGEHADAFNARRQQAYAADPALRAKARAAAKAYRKKAAKSSEIPEIREGGLSTSSRVAKILGITRQTLMNWEERGLIPRPTASTGTRRLYTEKQLDLLDDLYTSIGQPDFDEVKRELWQQWGVE
jgi:DNA-binding transcriptional regulator YiaG